MKRIGITLISLLAAAFVAEFFVVPGPMISTSARTGEGMLFAEIDERDAVIITYDDNGVVGRVAFGGSDAHVAAFELDSGETIWNRGLADGPAFLTRLIAAGDEYAYIKTTSGLSVIALTDGTVVRTEADIPGLGEVDTLRTDFAFSPSRDSIVFNPEEGLVREILLDTLEAVDVDAGTQDTWVCVVGSGGRGYSESDREAVTVDRMPVDGEVLGFGLPSGSPPGTPGKLGSDAGYAVIEHAQSARTEDRQITVVDAVSGEVLGTNPAEGGLVDAATAPSGQAVVIIDRFLPGLLPNSTTTPVTSTVLLISPEGSMREIVLAPHGWLGLPW